jgi:acetylornithine deacetylase
MFQRLEVQFNHRWRHEILGGGGYPLGNDSQGTGIFTINLSLIEGGTYLGAVPDYCKMIYCVWHPPWVKAEDVWNKLESHVKALASTDDWLKENPPIFKAPVLKWDPSSISLEHEGVQGLAQAFKEVTGEDAVISGFKAVCDATYFVKKGIPAAIFGPGDLRMGAHGPNEYIPIDHILKVAKVDAAFAIDWCSS